MATPISMFNRHIKFEMSTITCNEEMKGHAKCENFRFEPPFGGLRGNVHGSSMARWKARGRLPISANWTFFRQLSRLRRYEQILVEIVLLERGWITLSANFMRKGGSSINEFWRQKTRVPGLSRGVVLWKPYGQLKIWIPKNPRWRTAAIFIRVKLLYLSNGYTCRRETWYDDTRWPY